MKNKERFFYTKVFVITGAITLATIIVFGSFTGVNTINIIKERILDHNNEILNQINISFVDKINEVNSLLLDIYGNEENYQTISEIIQINEVTHDFFTDPFYKKDLNDFANKMFGNSDIYLVGFLNYENKTVLTYNTMLESWEFFPERTDFYTYIVDFVEDKQYRIMDYESYFHNTINYNIVMVNEVFKTIEVEDKTEIIVGYSCTFIGEIVNEYNESYIGETFILNDLGEVIFGSDETLGGNLSEDFSNIIKLKSDSVVTYNKDDYILSKRHDDENNLYFINLYCEKAFKEECAKVINIIALAILITISAIIAIYYFANKAYGKRTKKIMVGLESVGMNNLDYRIEGEDNDDEFGKIAEKFNIMCDELKENIEKSYVYRLKEKTAELGEMQAKINPHFLYNTLESIRECVINDNKENAECMITLLAGIFRNTVRKDTIISVREEIEISRMVLELYSIRFEEIFEYEIKVDEELYNYGILKNLFQPIIENFFKHGINHERADNYFVLNGYARGDYLYFELIDNGIGVDNEKLKEIENSIENDTVYDDGHYGLANITERIKTVYGQECGLQIKNGENAGLTIIIKIKCISVDDLKEMVNYSDIV